ncbi:anaerobic ribonucleoside-triphosphate reductase activating protein [candidate division WOR-3 bacterium]|nr:anaerobic ribonucleoside-triphosphate reductase activating protein [candidate division WOR-3 bacterium]
MIKSFLGTSIIEYPGKIASVVFIGGCNLRCPFCYNLGLVLPELLEKIPDIPENKIIDELKKRKGFIDGVSFTGGEPLLWPGLTDFLKRVKEEVKVDIKIDTNGMLPDGLKGILPFVDYISMDIKSSPKKYPIATGNNTGFEKVEASIEVIKGTKDYEFRTTMVPGVVDKDDLKKICRKIKKVKKYVLQGFRNTKTLSSEFSGKAPYEREYLIESSRILKNCAEVVELRE